MFNINLIILLLLCLWVHISSLEKLLKKYRNVLPLRRWWVKPHLYDHVRERFGGYRLTFLYFKLHDHEEFENFIGMPVSMFERLLYLTRGRLQKLSRRKPLCPELKLATVLSFLHNGGNVRQTATFYRIGKSTMYKLVKEVCSAIRHELVPLYFQPMNEENWLKIALGYENRWQMPHCLGAIDGRHFRVNKPPHSGSAFYNYKNFFSMVLLATCDAYYRFTWFNLGDFGSKNDASIFNNTDLCEGMQNNTLSIPRASNLPGSNISMPYYFVGDNIFAIQQHLMVPFPQRTLLTHAQKVFNYRLKRARLTIECAFGILVKRFAILQQNYGFKLDTMEDVIISTMCLHNMIITCNLEAHGLPEQVPFEMRLAADDMNVYDHRNANNVGTHQRNTLADYFVSDAGSVPWQNRFI